MPRGFQGDAYVHCVKGQRYSVEHLEFCEWSDATYRDTDFSYRDWFDSDEIYLGPDGEGCEPIFLSRSVVHVYPDR